MSTGSTERTDHRAVISIYQSDDRFRAVWDCSCGASGPDNLWAESIAIAIEVGRSNYHQHCEPTPCNRTSSEFESDTTT